MCEVSWCPESAVTRGYCPRHYSRVIRGGDPEKKTKADYPPYYCRNCQEQKTKQEFYPGKLHECILCARERCREYHAKNRETRHQQHREWRMSRKFNLTEEEYQGLLRGQGGVCAICSRECSSGRRLAVDHDHDTGRVRGLLCGNCNTGIGRFHDSVAKLQSAIRYLEGT